MPGCLGPGRSARVGLVWPSAHMAEISPPGPGWPPRSGLPSYWARPQAHPERSPRRRSHRKRFARRAPVNCGLHPPGWRRVGPPLLIYSPPTPTTSRESGDVSRSSRDRSNPCGSTRRSIWSEPPAGHQVGEPACLSDTDRGAKSRRKRLKGHCSIPAGQRRPIGLGAQARGVMTTAVKARRR